VSRKKIAAIVTTYFPGSHADHLVTKFVKGFPTSDGVVEPEVDIVSMYMDQLHPMDMGLDLAREHGIEIFPSIRSALTLKQPSKLHWPTAADWEVGELAVDGVLIIGEHGDYSPNERGRQMYPRRHFFEQVCGMIGLLGNSVPVFTDKHLAYNWDDAKWMYDRAHELNIPMMGGSSLPVTGRSPYLEHEIGAPIDEALSLGHFNSYHNGLDSYGFHGLEGLQCMVERRSGEETGIAAVQCFEGKAVWAAAEKDLWPRDLATAVESRIENVDEGRMEDSCINPAVFMLEYADGFRATTLMLDRHLKGFGYAARIDGEIVSTAFGTASSDNTLNEPFSAQGLAIQKMFLTGEPQQPIERSLLTTGAHAALMDSRYLGGQRIETPWLDVRYGE
jgi:hypothetical protein